MTARETPDLHDESAGVPAIPAGEMRTLALPTPSTPGYTYFTDYLGHRWTCCTCVHEFLTYTQQCWLKLGWIKSGIDVWQCTGGATDSAGTHSQGGAVDLVYQTAEKYVLWLRDHGATAAWRRTTSQGFTREHVHFVLRGCPHNSPARYQVVEEQSGPPTGKSSLGYTGGDGLTGTKFDYHRDPSPYMDWAAGVTKMKKELGLLALTTTSTLTLSPGQFSKGAWVLTTAKTSQSGTAYAQGTHAFDYLPAGTTTWKELRRLPAINGVSSFYHNYGSTQPMRVRFIPRDATVSKASTSAAVTPQPVDLPALQAQVASLASQVTTLTTENADLKAKLAAQPTNPPEPVPAYGVDVSGWQTVEQVRALVADPKNAFVIVKATQGYAYTSTGFAGYRDLAGDTYLGSYHYAEPPHVASQEMDHYLEVAGAGALLSIDVEYFDRGRKVTKDDPLSPEEEIQLATYLLDGARYLREKTGKRALTYTNWLWLPFIRRGCTVAQWDELVDISPLWLAQVASPGMHDVVDPKPGSTKGWPVALHQYAYTPDATGAAIDRDWTPDLSKLKAA